MYRLVEDDFVVWTPSWRIYFQAAGDLAFLFEKLSIDGEAFLEGFPDNGSQVVKDIHGEDAVRFWLTSVPDFMKHGVHFKEFPYVMSPVHNVITSTQLEPWRPYKFVKWRLSSYRAWLEEEYENSKRVERVS